MIFELDIDILKMYLPTKMNFLGQGFQKSEHQQHRQTHTQRDRQMRPNALPQPHSQVVKCSGGNTVPLQRTRGVSYNLVKRHPQLSGYICFYDASYFRSWSLRQELSTSLSQVRQRGPYVYRESVHRKINVRFIGTTTEFHVWRQQQFDEQLTTAECGPDCTEHDQVALSHLITSSSPFDIHCYFIT